MAAPLYPLSPETRSERRANICQRIYEMLAAEQAHCIARPTRVGMLDGQVHGSENKGLLIRASYAGP